MLATGLPYMAFIMSSKVPPTPSFFRTFILKGCWSLHKSFLHCFKWPHEFDYMTRHIYRSLCVELSLLPWNETYVIVMRYPFYLFLNLVGNFKKFICAFCVWAVPVPWLTEDHTRMNSALSFQYVGGWMGTSPGWATNLYPLSHPTSPCKYLVGHFYNHVNWSIVCMCVSSFGISITLVS